MLSREHPKDHQPLALAPSILADRSGENPQKSLSRRRLRALADGAPRATQGMGATGFGTFTESPT
eukprot:3447717-Prymnesium_polylepis.1